MGRFLSVSKAGAEGILGEAPATVFSGHALAEALSRTAQEDWVKISDFTSAKPRKTVNGVGFVLQNNRLSYTRDGLTFASIDDPFAFDADDIAWDGTYWLAVDARTAAGMTVMRSTDLVDWESINTGVGNAARAIGANPATGETWLGANRLLIMTMDGFDTQTVVEPRSQANGGDFFYEGYQAILHDGARFIVSVGSGTNSYNAAIAESTDGLNWTKLHSIVTIDALGIVNGTAFSLSDATGTLAIREGGVWSAWNAHHVRAQAGGSIDVANGLALARSIRNRIAVSSDGREWFELAGAPPEGGVGAVSFVGGRILVANGLGTYALKEQI